MSRNPSALASLTANYTDSENEDGNISDEESHHTEDSNESQVVIVQSKPTTPLKTRSTPSTPTKIEAKSGLRLVSYHDDTVISDEENVSPPNEIGTKMEVDKEEPEKPESEAETENPESKIKKEKTIEYGFSLPPEPKGKCPAELQEKIMNLYKKMKTNNMDMNKIIQERKEFRNPSIYEKLIQFCDIDELGTNYPPELYDPMQWGKDSFYEELAKVQKTEMEKKEKETAKTDPTQAPARKAEEEAKKRKSKWDQPAPSAPQTTTSIIKTSGLITTSITGTKGTVISAFGSLPKKPKV